MSVSGHLEGFHLEAPEAYCAAVPDAGKLTRVPEGRFHFAARDDRAIPLYLELATPP